MSINSEEFPAMTKRILIVDDETSVLFAYKKLFSILGVMVDVCETYEQAVELIRNNVYEIVITDIRLEGSVGNGGLEILRYVRKDHADTKVIIMTGYGTEKIKKEADDLGVSCYFEKPVSTDVIIEASRKLGVA